MKFTKLHGCGNDYVYVNLFEQPLENPAEMSIKVSDRHFGIGSDGLITIGPSEIADFTMHIYNADGSEAEMCGNGVRCVGKYVYDHGLTDKTEVTVETGAGIKILQLNVENGKVKTVRVDMGEPSFLPQSIPVIAEGEAVIDAPISVGGKEWNMTCVSMGNPHAVIFTDDVRNFPLETYGPLFENHERFPKRTNTEFVQVVSREEAIMRVWERGSAETWACGTGTCATAVACILNGLTQEWGQFFKKPVEQKRRELENAIKQQCEFPQIYVVKQDKTVVGSFMIKQKDLEDCDLSPWLACVVVKKQLRGKGYGRQVLEHIRRVCNQYPQVYLFTTLENFYEKIGFEYMYDIQHNGETNKLCV